ncbi:hypothetical protein TRFO_14167 [Tritrichomonas foetus]|uniref:Uncharacterized protein n=1 Tax=Tritrichomonas foetus TaxID=1144522 RepID=A0A1J4KWZ2_9EUKA|nr:hypothetical protein TRFO_14167 [Tritrichomonas foetus]|eukprot:OHT15400.1 hypothetical protein TRFO_14167 [Tritrichomonas foetus]
MLVVFLMIMNKGQLSRHNSRNVKLKSLDEIIKEEKALMELAEIIQQEISEKYDTKFFPDSYLSKSNKIHTHNRIHHQKHSSRKQRLNDEPPILGIQYPEYTMPQYQNIVGGVIQTPFGPQVIRRDGYDMPGFASIEHEEQPLPKESKRKPSKLKRRKPDYGKPVVKDGSMPYMFGHKLIKPELTFEEYRRQKRIANQRRKASTLLTGKNLQQSSVYGIQQSLQPKDFSDSGKMLLSVGVFPFEPENPM